MTIKQRLDNFKSELSNSTRLVAVSKFHPVAKIQEAYDAGHRVFGESRAQEFEKKHSELPTDIEWHFIGHLQRNKVRNILPYVSLIHSVDSVRLYNEIVKRADSTEKKIGVLLQVHLADEETKHGFTFDEIKCFLDQGEWKKTEHTYIAGLMTMASLTENTEQIRGEFKKLKKFFDEIKTSYFDNDNRFKEISMGMSNDYPIAIEEGATLIRIGTAIFGEREY